VSAAARDVESVYELSPLQEGLLVESLANPGAGLYVEQVLLDLPGALSPPALARAWRAVVERHPILRTSFHWQGLERAVQVVHRNVNVPIAHNNLRAVPPDRRTSAVAWFLQEDRARGLRFDRAPLLRVTMLQHGAAASRVVVTMHHILLDGWSVGIVVDEVARLYRSYVDGVPCRLDAARPYGEYIAWLRTQDRRAAEVYWRRALEGLETAPSLTRLGGTSERVSRFAELETGVPPDVAERLARTTRELRVTQNVAVLGAWAVVLGAELGVTDLVVGAVVSGRDASLARIDSVVGLCINTVPVRVRIRPDAAIGRWLADLHAEQLELREHQHSALTDVHGWSGLPRGRPLFESVFIFENHAAPQQGPSRGRAFERTNYPLTVLVGVTPTLSVKVLYDASIVSREVVERLLRRLNDALDRIGRDPSTAVEALLRAGSEEERRALELGEGPAAPPPTEPVHALVAKAARARPDATAIIDGERRVSYADLDGRSDALARRIRRRGVLDGDVVGVALERSAELIVAVLAVLKAGAAFLPLEPSLPADRLEYMVEDSGARLVVTAATLEPDDGVSEHDAPLPGVSLEAPAWLLYTSGSSGLPKGVLGSHRGLANRIEWGLREEPFAPDEVACLKTRLAFVDSLWELFGPLAAGVPLVIAHEPELRDPRVLAELILRERVTRLVVVPSLLEALLESAADELEQSSLRRLTSSGEPLRGALARRVHELLPRSTLRNLYGSTEVTADATWYEVGDAEGELVPIGSPLANTRVRLLGPTGEVVPVGAVGELHVGGAGLAIGYVGAASTGDRGFLPDPLLPGERLYRTGDLARWDSDGRLELLGRADRQLKVRGIRVEPAEIERALCDHTGVREAAVVPRDGAGGIELVAFVSGADVQVEELRSFLRTRLPDQLVPAHIVELAQLPRLPSGKTDTAALAGSEAAPVPADRQAPRTTAESLVAEAYATTLGIDEVGALDDFFALGGHSLLATRLASALGGRFELTVPLSWIFEHPVVADLARTIEDELVADIRRRGARGTPEATRAP
jgi:amino acid adenylation domain-containing protein